MFSFEKPKVDYVQAALVHKPLYFSYTQLETYERCHLQYKYRYALNIPTEPFASASYGSSIHKALLAFYKEYGTNKDIGKHRLLELYKESWIPVGYSSKIQENRMFEEGALLLSNYFTRLHKKNLSILALEKPFKLKLSNTLYITGKIDRIDKLSENAVEIIDYKTGKIPDENELRKNLQLSIYSMAATDLRLLPKPAEHISVTLYFLQESVKITSSRTKDEIATAKTRIKDAVADIFKNDFEPSVGLWCDFCPFKMICEAWQ